MNPFAWLTRPPTAAESAAVLAKHGHAAQRARKEAVRRKLADDFAQGIYAPMGERG